MPFRLWHFTWPQNVVSIQTTGFHDGDMGCVYFIKPPNRNPELGGQVLLEVSFDLPEAVFDQWINNQILDILHWDEQTKTHVETKDPTLFYRQTDYKIPAAFVNINATNVRLVPFEEYRFDSVQ